MSEMTTWQCERCGAVYAEYVNGCPECWHGNGEQPEPEVRSSVRMVKVQGVRDGAQ
jgi:predicted  nucleic acid-binding Zn-ribbon protein